MLAAVNLDDQLCRVRNEINDVGADWRLTTKANAIQTMRAQNTPENSFGFCRVCPQ
jgi:hypothetical protein